jgi:competence protein ComEA
MMKRLITFLVIALGSIHLAFAAVNINTATVEELDAVKGITPAKAKAIVDYRSNNGPFKTLDDLKAVKGFGDKSVAKLKDELVIGETPPVKAVKK